MGEMTIFRGETACFTAFVPWGTSAVAYASTAVPQGIYFVPNAISPVPAAFSPVPVAISTMPAFQLAGVRLHCGWGEGISRPTPRLLKNSLREVYSPLTLLLYQFDAGGRIFARNPIYNCALSVEGISNLYEFEKAN